MTKPNYVPFFFDDLDALELLGDAERGRLFTALLSYGNGEQRAAEELSGNEKYLFPMFRGRIDRYFAKYEEQCEKNRTNAKKKTAPDRERPQAAASDGYRPQATATDREPNEPSKYKSEYKSKSESETKSESRGKGAAAPAPAEEELPFAPFLAAAVKDWLSYKQERLEPYKPTGLKSLLSQLQKAAADYGEAAVAEVIRNSMASGYQGITLDRLKKPANGWRPNPSTPDTPPEDLSAKMARLRKLAGDAT